MAIYFYGSYIMKSYMSNGTVRSGQESFHINFVEHSIILISIIVHIFLSLHYSLLLVVYKTVAHLEIIVHVVIL